MQLVLDYFDRGRAKWPFGLQVGPSGVRKILTQPRHACTPFLPSLILASISRASFLSCSSVGHINGDCADQHILLPACPWKRDLIALPLCAMKDVACGNGTPRFRIPISGAVLLLDVDRPHHLPRAESSPKSSSRLS
jgi:hypothetical protein